MTNPITDQAPVLVHDDGPVRVVSLNRPARLNAINASLLVALNEALAVAMAESAVRAVVLAGEGRAFCAGDDLIDQVAQGAAARETLRPVVDDLQQVTRHLMFGDKPVVGLVQGWAVGGGFSWTLNCDLTLWAEGARAQLPEVGFGLFISGGLSLLLPRAMGRMAAAEAAWLGPRMSAMELQQLGIAWRVVPDAELRSEGLAIAHRLAALPVEAARQLKRSFMAPDRRALEAALALEADACVAAVANPETLARLKAFMEQPK